MLKFKKKMDVPIDVEINSNEFLEAVWKTDILSQMQVTNVLMSAMRPSDLRRLVEALGKENVQKQVLDKLTEMTERVQTAMAEADSDPSKRLNGPPVNVS